MHIVFWHFLHHIAHNFGQLIFDERCFPSLRIQALVTILLKKRDLY